MHLKCIFFLLCTLFSDSFFQQLFNLQHNTAIITGGIKSNFDSIHLSVHSSIVYLSVCLSVSQRVEGSTLAKNLTCTNV